MAPLFSNKSFLVRNKRFSAVFTMHSLSTICLFRPRQRGLLSPHGMTIGLHPTCFQAVKTVFRAHKSTAIARPSLSFCGITGLFLAPDRPSRPSNELNAHFQKVVFIVINIDKHHQSTTPARRRSGAWSTMPPRCRRHPMDSNSGKAASQAPKRIHLQDI